jgi:hypothetical protein
MGQVGEVSAGSRTRFNGVGVKTSPRWARLSSRRRFGRREAVPRPDPALGSVRALPAVSGSRVTLLPRGPLRTRPPKNPACEFPRTGLTLIRRREAPGGPRRVAFTIEACTEPTHRLPGLQWCQRHTSSKVTEVVERFRTVLVIQDPSEVSLLSEWGKARTPIRPVTDWHSLSPTSFTHSPTGRPSRATIRRPCGNGWAYPHMYHSRKGFDPAFPPVVPHLRGVKTKHPSCWLPFPSRTTRLGGQTPTPPTCSHDVVHRGSGARRLCSQGSIPSVSPRHLGCSETTLDAEGHG